MYQDHWKLVRRPFEPRVNPRWFFGSVHHRGAIVALQSLVARHEPFAALAAGPGYGKTMVAAVLADILPAETPAVSVHTIADTAREAFADLLLGLGRLIPECCDGRNVGDRDADELMSAARANLAAAAMTNRRPVVLLDAIDSLPDVELRRFLDAIRSIEPRATQRLSVILLGSSDLVMRLRRLADAAVPPFPQILLGSLAPADVAGYVSHCVRLAGGDPSIFEPRAVELIADLSGGIPRRINRLCDLSLLVAYSHNSLSVSESHVWTAQRENRVLSATRSGTSPRPHAWRQLTRI